MSAPAGVLPVTEQDLLPATKAYERYVSGRLPALLHGVERLRGDVAADNRGAAERDWLTAHLECERLGAEFELTGRTDFGSHSSLATVAANLAGTRMVLGMITRLLRVRYPALDQTVAALTRAQADLAAQDHHGR